MTPFQKYWAEEKSHTRLPQWQQDRIRNVAEAAFDQGIVEAQCLMENAEQTYQTTKKRLMEEVVAEEQMPMGSALQMLKPLRFNLVDKLTPEKDDEQ